MKKNLWLLLVLMGLAMFAFGCTDSDSDDDDDDTNDGDTDDDDDTGGDYDWQHTEGCDPACGDGTYCYENFCETIVCPTQCWATEIPATDTKEATVEYTACPANHECKAAPTDDSLYYCVKTTCSTDYDCNGGKCNNGSCEPHESCVFDECEISSCPGEPCEFGSLWVGKQCRSGDSCLGAGGTETDETCSSNLDCEASWGSGAYCTDDMCTCGFSFCATPCLSDGSCLPNPAGPDAPALGPATVSGSCFCIPAEFGGGSGGDTTEVTQQVGINEGCQTGSGDYMIFKGMECASGLNCLSSPAGAGTADCTTNEDCGAGGGCSPAGKCGFAACAANCNDDGYCEDYDDTCTNLMDNLGPGMCFCTYPPLGAACGGIEVGEPCDGFADACVSNATCQSYATTKACTENADCISSVFDKENEQYGPNAYCDITGGNVCRYSYCAQKCTSAMSCPSVEVNGSTVPTNYYQDGLACFCVTEPYATPAGDSQWGDACHEEPCDYGLSCKSNVELNGCSEDSDCTDAFGENGYCTESGQCAWSVCVKPCLSSGKCPEGEDVGKVEALSGCWCAPAPYGDPNTEICSKVCARDRDCYQEEGKDVCFEGQCVAYKDVKAECKANLLGCCKDTDCTESLSGICNDEWTCQ